MEFYPTTDVSRYISVNGYCDKQQQQQQQHGWSPLPCGSPLPQFQTYHPAPEEEEIQQREDVTSQAERTLTWNTLADTVHDIGEFIFEWKDQHCNASCFVGTTSNSMDRMEPEPTTTYTYQQPEVIPPTVAREQNMPMVEPSMVTSSSHPDSAVNQPIRFPSIHLDVDWDNLASDDESDSDGLFNRNMSWNKSQFHHRQQQQSIYRTPCAISTTTDPVTQFARQQQHERQQPFAPSSATSNGVGQREAAGPSFALYRSPAWSDEDEDSDQDVSIEDDDSADWCDISPGSSPKLVNGGSKAITNDIVKMEGMFEGFSLSLPSH
jgi:hypothetical protein